MGGLDAGWTGWVLTFASMVFFCYLRIVAVDVLFAPPLIIRASGDDYRLFPWRNFVVSFIHAILSGSCAVVCVILYGKRMREDMVAFVNWPIYSLCCFTTGKDPSPTSGPEPEHDVSSQFHNRNWARFRDPMSDVGYFFYDALDIILAKRPLAKWDILLHHLMILISASHVITYAECVGYQAFGVVVEINTIFLHRRQLHRMAGTSRADPSFIFISCVNIITFVIFRFFPLLYLTVGIYYDGHRVPRWYATFYSLCMALLNVINVILFYRLLRSDFLSTRTNGNRRLDHKKVDSIDGCCDGLNVNGSDSVGQRVIQFGEPTKPVANRVLVNNRGF